MDPRGEEGLNAKSFELLSSTGSCQYPLLASRKMKLLKSVSNLPNCNWNFLWAYTTGETKFRNVLCLVACQVCHWKKNGVSCTGDSYSGAFISSRFINSSTSKSRLVSQLSNGVKFPSTTKYKPEETHQGATPGNRKLSFSFSPLHQQFSFPFSHTHFR